MPRKIETSTLRTRARTSELKRCRRPNLLDVYLYIISENAPTWYLQGGFGTVDPVFHDSADADGVEMERLDWFSRGFPKPVEKLSELVALTARNRLTIVAPIHPGEVLLLDFLDPLGVTPHRLAVSIKVPPRRINEIVHGKRRISVDTALRLARFSGTSPRFWLNLPSRFNLEVQRHHLGSSLDAITPLV